MLRGIYEMALSCDVMGGGTMKWIYIAIGLLVAMLFVSVMQQPVMYTSKGETVLPIHMGVDNGK